MIDTVAILDPDETVRQGLIGVLGSLGIRASAYPDAESFQQALCGEQDSPNCLLLDASLASSMGRRIFQQFPTIVISTDTEPGYVNRLRAQGAAAIINKPVETWSLLTELSRILHDSPGLAAALPRKFVLDDGREVTIRAIQPEDARIEQAFVRSLSLASKQKRFFFPVKELSEKLLHEFTHPRYPDNWALIATVQEGGQEREIGVARYAPCRGSEGSEFAVVVADDWQGCGVASHLMRELLDVAGPANIKLIEGAVLRENRRMLEFIGRLGFVPQPHSDDPGVVRVVKVLGTPT